MHMHIIRWVIVGVAVNAVTLMLLFANIEGLKGLLEFMTEFSKYSNKS
ncbi:MULTISPECIES: hypothetical protein [Virgibacillus]|uniref:Uncharacterized protein n=2 Tax=Virgibacillus TaxID=84406 RepID=A0A024QFT1_9BACI|nr:MULTISPECIES: hypothetical protein [Virgibacillus]EQB38963.1 hypothetical protein M948_01040 [Virgibacillus sp. CM-4]MYL43324.1 hypothetical protein [Virgibacillus massiliensis]GGJ67538.1 hypothetical protein GCM10007111_31770 [Virgibacillus kapii]CDQ41087.1 hypothetical protein BN990_03439 [Virgibacillus massiliensis]